MPPKGPQDRVSPGPSPGRGIEASVVPAVPGARDVKALFFAYFGLIGAYSPYLSLYYAAVGLSIAQIGVLAAVPQLTRIVGPSFWGWLSDRVHRRVTLLRVSSAMALALTASVALTGGNYSVLLVLIALFSFSTAAQMPIAEAMAVAATGGDAGRYGRLRVWGSIGFTIALVGAGPLLDRIGVARLPWVMVALTALLLMVAWRMPEPPAPPKRSQVAVWRRLGDPLIAAFFVANFLMMFAHAALYGFYSLYLDGFGWSKSAIGLTWTIGVVAEIVVFRVQHLIFGRFTALGLLGFSVAIAALRFALLAWAEDALPGVIVGQLLHAITFGVHHSAVMALIHRWFEPGQQGRAQALYVTIGYGLGGSCGGLAASWLWQHVGPGAAFHGASVAAGVGWLAVLVCGRIEYARGRRSVEAGMEDPKK